MLFLSRRCVSGRRRLPEHPCLKGEFSHLGIKMIPPGTAVLLVYLDGMCEILAPEEESPRCFFKRVTRWSCFIIPKAVSVSESHAGRTDDTLFLVGHCVAHVCPVYLKEWKSSFFLGFLQERWGSAAVPSRRGL